MTVRLRLLVCVALAIALVAGRAGIVTLASEPPSGSGNCTEPAAPTVLQRLSKTEYGRTIRDLIGADVAEALPALAGLVAGLPDDDMAAGFSNINWTLSADHVTSYLGVANEIGVQVAAQPSLRRKIIACAAGGAPSAKCVADFLDRFASRAYRRPLETAEKDDLLRFYADRKRRDASTALSSLISRVLMSPNFLFKQGAGPVRATTTCRQREADQSFGRASRLSYGLWGTMPDAALLAAAGSGDLLNEARLDLQVDRMLHDTRARDWMRRFFRQWLRYDAPDVEGYSWPFLANIGREHLHEYAGEELDHFLDHVVWDDKGSFADLMTSRKVFTTALNIRRIYMLPEEPVDGEEQVSADRAGALTRVALLAHGKDDASVVKRGAFIRRQILCDTLNPPDPALLPADSLAPLEKNHELTTRQRWEARTSPTMCQGCHRMINPLGFVMERYDGIGRFRSVEKLPVPSSSPQAYREHAIDAAVNPFVDSRTDPVVDGPVALSAFLAGSRKANSCFVKQLTKFVSGRASSEADQPSIDRLTDDMMRPGGSVVATLARIAAQQASRQ